MACKQVTLQVNDGRIGIHTNSVLVTTGINAQSVVPLFVTPVFKEFIATSINAANTDIPVGARIWKFNGRRLFTAQDATEKLPGTEVTVDFLPPATSSVVHESILDFHILHACVHDFFEQYDREKVPTAAVFAGPHVGDSSNICMALIQACPHAPITDQTLQYLKYFSSLQQISRYTATTINTSQPKTEAPEQLDLSVYQGLLRWVPWACQKNSTSCFMRRILSRFLNLSFFIHTNARNRSTHRCLNVWKEIFCGSFSFYRLYQR